MTKFEIILSVCETHSESGYIRIGSAQSISYHWLPDILREFSEEYPNIIFDVTVGGSQELIDKLIAVSIHDIANEEFISNVDKFDFEAGFGISVLPQLLLYRTPFDICVRPFTEHFQRTLGVAARKEAKIYPATQKLLEYVKHWKKIPVSL